MRRLIFAVCLTGAPLLAIAQSMIYKVQMPDGSVLYSDSVPSGGKVLEERESKSTPRVTALPPQTGAKPTPPTAGAGTRQGSIAAARPSANKGASPDIPTLERELSVAKRQLETGREPLPGERLGLAGGGSRLTPEYEARIAAMEREVAQTEAKLKKAYESR